MTHNPIDLAWFNRGDLSRSPIRVRTAAQIGREARWGRTVRGLAFVGKAAAIAVAFIVIVALCSCV